MYYVYVLARPDGKVFYVGKGKGERIFKHDAEAKRGCRCHKCNVIRKIWKSGGEVQRYTVFTTENEQEAFDYECELIALYGRENLCNRTDGGEGTKGKVFTSQERARLREKYSTPEHRAKMRIAAQKRPPRKPASDELKQKLSEMFKGRKPHPITPEGRQRISEANRGNKRLVGKKASDETKRKMSEAHKGKVYRSGFTHSEETKQKMSQAHKGNNYRGTGFKHSEATRQKMSEARKGNTNADKNRTYKLMSPTGEHFVITRLPQFCREHGINLSSMSRVVHGQRTTCHGWTGRIIEESM